MFARVASAPPPAATRDAPWIPLAALSYAATISLGLVSLRRRVGRAWHGRLFGLTFGLTAGALILSLPARPARALALSTSLAPLALLPWRGTPRSGRLRSHVATGLAAAPGYAAALALWAVRR